MSEPNLDPADDGDMNAILEAWLKSFIREHLDDMIPATVVDYDDASNRATIKPLIMMGTATGQKISRAPLGNIPVFRFGGGGFFMRFPIKPGDFGWLKATDRDMSLMLQRGGLEDWPNTERLHSFSDAMFFPDTLRGWSIDDSSAAVFQSIDGSVCIALSEGKITLKAPEMDVVVPLTNWTGDVIIDGNLTTSGGNVSMSGGTLTHDGKNIGGTHTHSGVVAGGDNTGGPN